MFTGDDPETSSALGVPPGSCCLYPPQIANEIEVNKLTEDGVTRYFVRHATTLRYFLLGEPEHSVFARIDGTRSVAEIALPEPGLGPSVPAEAVVRFLKKLDSFGLIARGGGSGEARARDRGLYRRIHLFNPDHLLRWLDRRLRWLLTARWAAAAFVFLAVVTIGLLVRADEAGAYVTYAYSEYGLATILVFTLVIALSHELAHGLACKHFGGEVRDLGVLMIFYVVPAFYCNTTDLYRLPRKRDRIWVIFAGIFWQLLISGAGGFVWLVTTPHTVTADVAFLILLGGTFNLILNCNPLIRLDGYYALSQITGVPNLQKRSFEYTRQLAARLISGRQTIAEGRRPLLNLRPGMRAFLIGYWLCSIAYSLALVWLIVEQFSERLADWLGFGGILLTLLLVGLLSQSLIKPIARAVIRKVSELWAWLSKSARASFRRIDRAGRPAESPKKGVATMLERQELQKAERAGIVERVETEIGRPHSEPGRQRRRRRLVNLGLALVAIAALAAPWEASTGSDCTLLLPPGRESAARANVEAVLVDIYVQPGDVVAQGAKIARLSNPEMEDRLTQLNAEITRLDTNSSRLEEELRVRSELILSASLKERERQQLATELKEELRQISRVENGGQLMAVRGRDESAAASAGPSARPTATGAVVLPAALAVLESEIELKEVELSHNRQEVQRYKQLFEQGLVGSQQYDAALNAMRMSEKELERARARLEAALVEHRRFAGSVETGSLVAQTEARAARSNFEALIAEMHANRQQLESLRHRREILEREYEGMNVVAPQAGVVLGEDLRKMISRRYSRGEEIVRIGELEKFLLRIEVSEREIASVTLDSAVRFKLKTVPGRTFTGQVSKINAEPAVNQYGQRFYPVEVLVDNKDGLLRPGMSGYARISFGRQSIGLILAEKVWQALRPELWLF